MRTVVSVDSITKDGFKVLVTASNSGFGVSEINWYLSQEEAKTCHVGKQYKVNVEEVPS